MQASFVSWEFEDTGLATHYFWRKSLLPYSSIVSVTVDRRRWIRIETTENPDPVNINPRCLDEFLLALKQHAPGADFQTAPQPK
jgi:hypothetical protein